MSQDNIFEKYKVTMIDFGFASKYVDDKTNEHICKERVEISRGNMEFASINQMKFYSTSRRDVLISLFYLMVYMFKGGEIPSVAINPDQDLSKAY